MSSSAVLNYMLHGTLYTRTYPKIETVRHYYPSGGLYEESQVKDGKRHGITTLWTPTGALWSQSSFYNDVLHGTVYMWSTLIPQFIEEEINYLDGVKHGVYRKWNTDGTLHCSTTYFKGNIHGTYFSSQEGITNYIHGQIPSYPEDVSPFRDIPFEVSVKIRSPKLKQNGLHMQNVK